ncbi:hypothetical protein QFZ82_007801 [Streptomyces sp. V4I23]|uniref:hypothetical protein n=1 Tax=Streptomyces sp. V4I23 TaxID=3042282 RepID=UPI002784CD08|nr:hypothetical protein [Streptomyces sp. V4I23]MDQ1013316.1 hypothetical protein [Streptomyces sp. V4I23]
MARNRPAQHGDFRPVYHPAGHDQALRVALEDLRTGRWMAMRTLLAHTGTDWALRTSRSQVLAAAAAGSDVVQAWRAEEPNSADALMMRARIMVERALQARRHRHFREEELAQQAREACELAAHCLPDDPVPWVCLLALAQLDEQQLRQEQRVPPPERTLLHGPWQLLQETHIRHPFNREAYQRMLQFFYARAGGSPADALHFVHWVASLVPEGSAVLVLPLYAYARYYRTQRERTGSEADPLVRQQWRRVHIVRDTDRALQGWFRHPDAAPYAALDLNHLAHALWAGSRFSEAAEVFGAIGVYATHQPWMHVTDVPGRADLAEQEFVWARAQCLAAAEAACSRGARYG